MPWVIFAAVIWLVILVFWRAPLKRYWYAGLWTLLIGYFFNNFFTKHGFYLFKEILYPVQAIPAAYLLGLIGIGIIIVSFLPASKTWQLPYLICWSALLAVAEIFAKNQGYLDYVHWTISDSFASKLFALIAITWLSSLTVKRQKSGYFINRGSF